eukprot:TRINITY_DN524_c0_g1_i1.p1 TRINITY_DN524_c0_g1~~TRINITY_DN524_c0_g1_i1.p1  ORF type:complete len:215 (+),score=32.70 TRINITY_DN524_c0_g1_i1:60-647(+)
MTATPPCTEKATPKSNSNNKDVKKRRYLPRGKKCNHNNWDNVRVETGMITLRCRECQCQYRTKVESVFGAAKCELFTKPEGCPLGDDCSKIHIHFRKQSLKERVAGHGVSVLDRVKGRSKGALRKIVTQLRHDAEIASAGSSPMHGTGIKTPSESTQTSSMSAPPTPTDDRPLSLTSEHDIDDDVLSGVITSLGL